jgi:glycosyltransferase involved in cell wall biosynthesis
MSSASAPDEQTPRRRVSIVTPFYDEAGMVAMYFERLEEVLRPLAGRLDFEFVCVNDGSRDGTLAELQAARPAFGRIVLVDLSRNFGKEAALSAGLDFATGDALIPMDADLQDPPELVPEMISRWLAGAPVVLAVREDRRSDGWLKSSTAAAFYAVHNRLADVAVPPNAGDFRLIDRRVADVVRALPERQRFMKGLFSWAGFPAQSLSYTRPPRARGHTKWNYARLLNLAVEGITSFSTAPLRASTVVGAVFAFVAMLYGGLILVRTLVYGVDLPGYASVFVAVVFMGGVQLLSLGILGEYVGRIYMESKQRPVYVVRSITERASGDATAPGS